MSEMENSTKTRNSRAQKHCTQHTFARKINRNSGGETIRNPIEQQEKKRQLRISQSKIQWNLKYQRVVETRILYEEFPLNHCDQNCISLWYLSIKTEDNYRSMVVINDKKILVGLKI